MFIYCIRNKINDKKYIGYDTHPIEWEYRWRAHQRYEDSHGEKRLYNSMRHHGNENFEYTVIDTAENIEELKQKEIFHIAAYRSFEREFGYNQTRGGDGQTKDSYDRWFNAKSEDEQKEIKANCLRGMQDYLANPDTYKEFCELVSVGAQVGWDRLSEEEKTERTKNHTKRFKHQDLEGEEREEYLRVQAEKYKEWFNSLNEEEKITKNEKSGAGVQKFYDDMTQERREEIDNIHRKNIACASAALRDKSYEEIYGVEKGAKMRALRSKQMSERENLPENKIKKQKFWYVTHPDFTIRVCIGSKSMQEIFNNLKLSGITWRISQCRKFPLKTFDGYRIDYINTTKDLFHYMGMQFCKTKINTEQL